MEAYEPNYTPTKGAVYIGIDFHKHYSVFCITDDVEQAQRGQELIIDILVFQSEGSGINY